jgi:glycosyltransferase involved in cell wall biosynthesis
LKNSLHYHSDCPFFAGCENMLVNFFSSKRLNDKFDLSFSYRYTDIYESGFRSRVKAEVNSHPLDLLDKWEEVRKARQSVRPAIFRKILNKFVKDKYFVLAYNYIVLRKYFKNKKIDILHINNGGYPGAYSCISAIFAARHRGIKNIVFVVNNIAVKTNSKFDGWIKKKISRYVTTFVTGSKFAGKALIEELNLPEKKYKNIHNGIKMREITESKEDVLKRLDIGKFDIIIGIVALLEERKGHIYLIKAVINLIRKNPDKKILLAIEGEGPEKNKLIEYVNDNDPDGKIRFIGNEKNVFNFINVTDIMVLPSIANEDFPNVVIESMSLGKAVIASRIAGVPEQIDDGVNGIIVEPKDIDGLESAIDKLISDRKLVETIGKNAKKKFGNEFSDEISVERYLRLYEDMLKKT